MYPPLLGGALCSAVYFLLQNALGKKFLEDVAGLGPASASSFMLLTVATAMTFAFLTGPASAWIGHRRKPLAVASVALSILATGLALAGIERWLPGGVFLVCYIL